MSAKKKNPLKDLSAFLAHQEEQTNVPVPKKLSDATEEFMGKRPTQITKVGRPSKIAVSHEATPEVIENLLIELANKDENTFRNELYKLVVNSIEKLKESTPADKMLINTALYLSDQNNWKEIVRTYWENR